MDLTITPERAGDVLTLYLDGEINGISASELRNVVDGNLDGTNVLIFDFTLCDYVSSAGIRVLLSTLKGMNAKGGRMQLRNVGEFFHGVLEQTNLDTVFDIQ